MVDKQAKTLLSLEPTSFKLSYSNFKPSVIEYILNSKRNAYFAYMVKCINWGLNTELMICKVSLMN